MKLFRISLKKFPWLRYHVDKAINQEIIPVRSFESLIFSVNFKCLRTFRLSSKRCSFTICLGLSIFYYNSRKIFLIFILFFCEPATSTFPNSTHCIRFTYINVTTVIILHTYFSDDLIIFIF